MDTQQTLILGAVVAAAIGLLVVGVPAFFAEYFPVQLLLKQRNGHPTITTASYAGRTALVTGANGAYGRRAAGLFAKHGVSTLVLVDLLDCGEVKEQILADVRAAGAKEPTILVWQMDMMTFAGCKALADKARTLQNIDHALLTAGVLLFNRRVSPEGWETSIQVNYLSTALIALFLVPLLKSSPGNPEPPVITFVTSFGIYPSSFTMGVPSAKSGVTYLRKMSTNKEGIEQGHQYGRSKCLLLYFARELSIRTAAAAAAGKIGRVTVTSADPGSAWTPLTQPSQSKLIPRLIMNISARDPIIGATALVNGASAPAAANGKIMHDFDSPSYPPFMSRKSGLAAQKQVWEESKQEFESKVPEVAAVYELLSEKA